MNDFEKQLAQAYLKEKQKVDTDKAALKRAIRHKHVDDRRETQQLLNYLRWIAAGFALTCFGYFSLHVADPVSSLTSVDTVEVEANVEVHEVINGEYRRYIAKQKQQLDEAYQARVKSLSTINSDNVVFVKVLKQDAQAWLVETCEQQTRLMVKMSVLNSLEQSTPSIGETLLAIRENERGEIIQIFTPNISSTSRQICP
ncbi:hypothetical protein NI389_05965 [Pseudoalteromonas xiamenensis]|uniref:hypothetical protein n=1 Tax=Pseudoalteromonas xiamenensis TaxID=882626 RepID=UPI0027E3C3CE|nr:hypothetical protein [Pseudoalteromonas xiamenensis]WMN60942.1 hypothetical protein NI389_05965 [Pseudoalteromonas xiamenensis]